MKTVGIIAEYNPFHNGHLYQLKKAKELSGADYAVIVLSGDFTQRGTPAFIDKYARTEMALLSGADLVLELPVRFATGSAEAFAQGAVSLLHFLSVDSLCFGSECGSLSDLSIVAKLLAEVPPAFRDALSEALKDGRSYPAARSEALKACLPADFDETVLQSPNNILGIEYLKAIYKLNSNMEPFTIKREGSGYLEPALKEGAFSSALALRNALFSGDRLSAVSSFVPESTLQILKSRLAETVPLTEDDFSTLLFYRLLSLEKEGYTAFYDVSQALSDKIAGNLFAFQSWSRFCALLKSKDLTYTRINRCLLHILLGIKKEDSPALYARVLGFRASSRPVFSTLSKKEVPLVSKLADADKLLNENALFQLQQDIFAAHLYDAVFAQKNGGTLSNEYRREIIIR